MMSDSSDSDDDVQMQQFLQAADSTLLTNAMFQQNIENNYVSETTLPNTPNLQPAAPALNTISQTTAAPKSERFLEEDDCNNNENNFRISKEIQSHVWRKLTTLISEQVEFCDRHERDQLKDDTTENKKNVDKSKVRLLQDTDCYVKAYEDIVEKHLGKQVKPNIQRRQIDVAKVPITKETLSSLAVSGEYIQAGSDTKTWAPRPNRLHKVFQYTATSRRGVLHSRQPENEFSERRRKRQWHSNQIKQRLKTK